METIGIDPATAKPIALAASDKHAGWLEHPASCQALRSAICRLGTAYELIWIEEPNIERHHKRPQDIVRLRGVAERMAGWLEADGHRVELVSAQRWKPMIYRGSIKKAVFENRLRRDYFLPDDWSGDMVDAYGLALAAKISLTC